MLKSSSLCLYSSNLDTFWLKIKQFWPFEEISIFSNGGNLGWRAWLSDIILKGTDPGTPLPKLCPLIPIFNQNGRQAKNRKKGGLNFNCPLLL
jgi:hypothetical protein